ncbi:phosphotransferase [Geodermatophilus ruber]|uniref:Aminoglycoside phosphotransferase domain-containing protein n=1 Tax=Geodermatophilus ruber TaxID=504800 RepID=A0A1I4DH35_9ACTN|nr:phosphotransferase [Geodermatophilus ruber]SFK92100.1 hypothetical protein SAMN04488085_104360 [Geodermatophilus ruber]
MSAAAELDTLLRLLGPADGTRPRPLVAALPWAPVGAGAVTLVEQVARRCRLAVRTHASAAGRGRPRVVRPVRGSLRNGLRDRLRRRAGSGYVASLPSGGPTLLDLLLQEAGVVPVSRPAVGADGAVRIAVRRGRQRAVLRMGRAGSAADPSPTMAGLHALARLEDPRLPAVLGSGERAEVRWLLETMLPGRRPRALSGALLDDVAALVATLPHGTAPVAVRDDAEVLAAAAPDSAPAVRRAADSLAASPVGARSQLRHGDLWAGNLLADDSGLTGVVDWDAWSWGGVPAVDLLHLIGTDERIRTRSSLGEVWLRRPWEDPRFTTLVGRHWPEWGADGEMRALVGTAWWLGQLASDLRRNPALAADRGWVSRNISAVAQRLP